MAGDLQPLDDKFAIVGSDGRPTLYFIEWAQQRQIDITASITSEQFDILLLEYLLAHQLQEGDGIALTPDGNLDNSPEISVRNGTGLNFDGMGNIKIADTAVTPGTYGDATNVGQFTVDQQGRITAAANVAISGGGGGGALTKISTQVVTGSPAANIDFSSIPDTYEDLIIAFQGRGSVAAAVTTLLLRMNNDSAGNYDFSRFNRFGNASNVAQTSLDIGSLLGSTAPAGNASQTDLVIINYKRTTFRKTCTSVTSVDQNTTAGGQNTDVANGLWRNTAAINRLTLIPGSGNFEIGTVATLYGRG